MARQIHLTLDEIDVGQIVDGLEARAKSWRDTYEYLSTGEAPGPLFIAEDCSDSEEAKRLAETYERLISEITEQVRAQ